MTAGNGSSSLIEMAQGYFRGRVLCAAVRLGIAEALSDGEKSLEQLAGETRSDADALYRLLRALAGIGVVQEVAPARFALTPLGEPLSKNAPHSVWASIVFWADLIADSWTYLPECVRAGGKSGADAAMKAEGVTSRWSREPRATEIFHAVFAEPGIDEMAAIPAAFDFSRCRVVADLGGAGGGLLAAILTAHPEARGILVDRTEAVERAARRLRGEGVDGRCLLVAGDLLEEVPAGADAYIMSRLLHGYPDGDARRILRNCHAAMSPESRLLIVEAVLPTTIDTADPSVEKMVMSDLNMMLVTSGRERNAAQWTSLLSSTGFEPRRFISIPASTSSIIECVSTD
jgi:O-methyltransferase domain/Dimerisation domain